MLLSMISLSTQLQLTRFAPNQIVKFSNNGLYLGYIFLGPQNPANMCDILYPATTPGRFMMTKVKKAYSIKVNCDGDGMYTSYLADNAADLIQPRRTAFKDTWIVSCASPSVGCTIQASRSKMFLAPSPAAMGGTTLSTTPAYWIAETY